MTIEAVLSRLDGVKKTGNGRWVARCPAHADKRPSLAIRELDDGKILLKCFAECSADDVLAAIGLTFEELFPERGEVTGHPKERRPFNPMDVLRCIAFEALIVSIAASRLAQGTAISDNDRVRLLAAASRLQAAVEVCNG